MGTIFSAVLNRQSAFEANMTNAGIAKATNDIAEKQFAENMEFQREQYEYQKQLQQQIFERDDTAIQRYASDARAAGISPLAALQGSGNTNSSVGVGGVAPTASTTSAHMQPTDFSSLAGLGQELVSIVNGIQQAKGQKIANDFNSSVNKVRLSSELFDSLMKDASFTKLMQDKRFMDEYGITESMSKEERVMQIIKRDLFHILPYQSERWRNDFKNPVTDEDTYNFSANSYYHPSMSDFAEGAGENAKEFSGIIKDILSAILGLGL